MTRFHLACAAACLAAGCVAGWVPQVGESAPTAPSREEERAYQAVLDAHTARAEVYEGFDTRAFFAATHQAPRFVRARVEREAQLLRLPPNEAQARLQQALAELEGVDAFVLGVHLNEPRDERFGPPDPTWRLALWVDGEETVPSKVERLGRATLPMRAYYPYLGDFWVAYAVEFPKAGPGDQVLRISSPLGRVDLAFPRPSGLSSSPESATGEFTQLR